MPGKINGKDEIGGAFLAFFDTMVRGAMERIEAEQISQGTGPALLTRPQAADYLAMSLSAFDDTRKTGQIKGIKVNGLLRFVKSDLDRCIQKLRKEAG